MAPRSCWRSYIYFPARRTNGLYLLFWGLAESHSFTKEQVECSVLLDFWFEDRVGSKINTDKLLIQCSGLFKASLWAIDIEMNKLEWCN